MSIEKHSTRKKLAVTPAIATMVLLSGTLVLSIIVGAYTYSLMGPNSDKVLLTSILLYGGASTDNGSVTATSSLMFSLRNPGPVTNITSVILSGASIFSPINSWSTTQSTQTGNGFLVHAHNSLTGGKSGDYTYYAVQAPSVSVLLGQTFNYVIAFANGQSITGSLVAQ